MWCATAGLTPATRNDHAAYDMETIWAHAAQAPLAGNPNPGINGGIPGSFPIWGKYITNTIPNWAAKYFIDALMAKQRALSNLSEHPQGLHGVSPDLARTLPAIPLRSGKRKKIYRVRDTELE